MNAKDLTTVLLLLAAHANAQMRGSVRGSARPAQQSAPTIYLPLANAYRGPFGLSRLVNNATVLKNGANGYAAPAPTVDPSVQCDAKWSVALRRQVMNPDNWQCSTRTAADGSSQPCVITGPTSASVFKNISACGWRMPVFCDNTITDLMASLLKPKSSNVSAPAGYTLIEGSGYYKVHVDPLPWNEAKTFCENEVTGGHLALLGKPSEYQDLLNLLTQALPTQTQGAFVGYNDVAVEGTFVSTTGQLSCMLGKLIFFGGRPNNFGGNENCLTLGYAKEANLNDFSCTQPLPYICELTLPSMMVPC